MKQNTLYLMFAVAPFYVFSFLIALKLGALLFHGIVWIVAWIAVGLMLYFKKETKSLRIPGAGIRWLRVIHGGSALLLLCGFLIAHLVNHDLALWSVKLHGIVMKWLRLWYRSELVEPVLLGLLLVMVCTGMPMVAHFSRRKTDAFRAMQMATGVYIGLFLCAHLLAVLGARSEGVETDWKFATGPTGLLNGPALLIPYYIFAVFFLILHLACGLRIVLLKHGVAEVTANRSVYLIASAGLVITSVIATAALGFHIQNPR